MNGRIREYTREECPICGHRDWCGRREDGLVLCRRPPTPREVPGFAFKGTAKDGTTGMYVETGREYVRARSDCPDGQSHRPATPRADATTLTDAPTSSDKVDPQWLTENHPRLVANLTSERRAALAEALGLPVCAMDALAIGWWPQRCWWNPETRQHEGEPGCWTFPEYDAHDRIIGLGLRWPTGHKGQMARGRRGIVLSAGWRELPDPVLIVEGPSDVLAGRALGLNVIGRPSNSGGAELLAHLCRNRRVIIVGENDRKPDGRWPGQDGADAIAGKLSEAWSWPVPVVYPPDVHKDLRAWAVAQFATLEGTPDEQDLGALRTRFLGAVQPPAVLLMSAPRARRGGRVSVKAFRWSDIPAGGPLYGDRLDLESAKARARFAAAVAALAPDADTADLENRLLKLHITEASARQRPAVEPAGPIASAAAPTSAAPSSNDRPRIQGNERQLRDTRNDALGALVKANDPPRLFSRAGSIARVVLVSNEQKDIVPRIQQLDTDALRGEMTNAADWFTLKHLKDGDVQSDDLPPLAVARDILALPSVELPPLIAIITCPTFAADGSLIVADGYDRASGLWHHRTLDDMPAIPEQPTGDEVVTARDVLLDIVAEFPFVDRASRANAISLMLLPFVRPLIDGPTPQHAGDAPTAGTGKDLLVKAALLPALGYAVGVTTAAKDPDEWRKKITSALAAGSPAVVWGNITHRLDSEHLAAVLTDVAWKDRLLGQTRELTLPNFAVWACTGNNLSFSKELARRVVWIRLDAKVEAPEQRTGFRHPNLLAYVRDQRPVLVAAALTLVRAWLAAGRPKGRQVMGSFESYAETLGGILDVAGVEDFLANADELRRQADTETSEWRAFVRTWCDRWHDAWVGVSDLAELLWEADGKRTDLLPTVVNAPTQRGAVTQLGRRLSAKRDCVIGDRRLLADANEGSHGRLAYRLAPINLETSGLGDGSLHEVSQEVSASNPRSDGDLRSGGDSGRPSGNTPLHTCASENAQAGSCGASDVPAHTRGMAQKSPKVSQEPQQSKRQELTSGDFRGDFRETSTAAAESLPHRNGPVPGSDGVPAGWTTAGWIARLRQLADRCESIRPDLAAQHRAEADRLENGAVAR